MLGCFNCTCIAWFVTVHKTYNSSIAKMRRLILILLLSALRMCGVTPCYAQLTAPAEHLFDTTKVSDSSFVFSEREVVNMANDQLRLEQLEVENVVQDSTIVALKNETKVQQQKLWSYTTYESQREREMELLRGQIKDFRKQIENYDTLIEQNDPNWFEKNKGELGILLGIVIGIVIVKLLK